MTIGEKILNMRKARGWSQEELAEHIGVSRQAVSRWESGSAKPDADKIIAICDLFGVSADYLLRDIAGGKEETLFTAAKQRTHHRLAWAAVSFGGITLLILNILASVNRIYVSPVFEAEAGGGPEVMVQPGHYTGFSDYVNSRGLDWLAWMAGIALLLGGGYLLFRWYYRLWKKNAEGETR